MSALARGTDGARGRFEGRPRRLSLGISPLPIRPRCVPACFHGGGRRRGADPVTLPGAARRASPCAQPVPGDFRVCLGPAMRLGVSPRFLWFRT